MTDRAKPWQVTHVEPDPLGGYSLCLFNHYTGRRAYWSINPRFAPLDRRYDFSGAAFANGGEAILDDVAADG